MPGQSILGSQRALLKRLGSQPKPLPTTLSNPVLLPDAVTTLAGSSTGFLDGTGTAARFFDPRGITISSGNLYVTDMINQRIRKITPAGVVTSLAGSISGYLDGTGTAAQFSNPQGITADSLGNFYVVDTGNQKIRKITPAGVVTTIAGSTLGFADGTGAAARFDNFAGITIASDGNLYVADTGNNRIRKIVISTGVVTTLAGSTLGFTDGTGTAAQFNQPHGIVEDSGNLYVADSGNNRIRKIVISTGVVTTLAGSISGYLDATGTAAQFNNPRGLIPDSLGNLYVADTGGDRIRKIVISTGVVTTIAGSINGYLDGAPNVARFSNPYGITLDSGNLYVTDRANNRIRKITFN